MLAGGYQHPVDVALQFGISIVIVRRRTFLHPLQIVWFERPSELDGIGNGQRHITIEHQPEIRADRLASPGDQFDILLQSFIAVAGTVWAWDLSADESQLFGF